MCSMCSMGVHAVISHCTERYVRLEVGSKASLYCGQGQGQGHSRDENAYRLEQVRDGDSGRARAAGRPGHRSMLPGGRQESAGGRAVCCAARHAAWGADDALQPCDRCASRRSSSCRALVIYPPCFADQPACCETGGRYTDVASSFRASVASIKSPFVGQSWIADNSPNRDKGHWTLCII